jgi:hypothetical protein
MCKTISVKEALERGTKNILIPKDVYDMDRGIPFGDSVKDTTLLLVSGHESDHKQIISSSSSKLQIAVRPIRLVPFKLFEDDEKQDAEDEKYENDNILVAATFDKDKPVVIGVIDPFTYKIEPIHCLSDAQIVEQCLELGLSVLATETKIITNTSQLH